MLEVSEGHEVLSKIFGPVGLQGRSVSQTLDETRTNYTPRWARHMQDPRSRYALAYGQPVAGEPEHQPPTLVPDLDSAKEMTTRFDYEPIDPSIHTPPTARATWIVPRLPVSNMVNVRPPTRWSCSAK